MDVAFYDQRVSEKVPTSDNPEMVALVDRIEKWCQIDHGNRVLDFGCYDGFVLRSLRARKNIHGVGVDIAPSAIELANRIPHSPDLEFVVSDGRALPFENSAFDVVVCSEILEHVPDLDGALAELSRVLSPRGILYATMPNSLRDVWPPFRPLCRRIDRIEGHLRRMSRNEFASAMASHGLKPLRARYRGFAFTAVWYGKLIYTPTVKSFGFRLLDNQKSVVRRASRLAAHIGMHAYMLADRPFAKYHGCLTIDGAFIKHQAF